jgi:hypothetical protein
MFLVFLIPDHFNENFILSKFEVILFENFDILNTDLAINHQDKDNQTPLFL